jgi:hypothetical protein
LDLNVDIVLGDGQVGLGDRIYTSELRQHGETPPARAEARLSLFIPLPERPTRCVYSSGGDAPTWITVARKVHPLAVTLDVNRKQSMHDANSFSERFAAPLPILVWSMSMFEHHLDFISTLVQPAACKMKANSANIDVLKKIITL